MALASNAFEAAETLGPFVYALRIVQAIAFAMVFEALDARARGKALALLQAWFNIGIALAASALGALAETSGYRDVFAVAGLCCAAALSIVLLQGREKSSHTRRPSPDVVEALRNVKLRVRHSLRESLRGR